MEGIPIDEPKCGLKRHRKISPVNNVSNKLTRSITWTSISCGFALLVMIFDIVKLVRVFSLKLLRGIPKEWTFELNALLSFSFFFHLMGFVYAIGLPEKNSSYPKKGEFLKKMQNLQIYSYIAAAFITLVLIFHIISTVLLINYSPPNYLLI